MWRILLREFRRFLLDFAEAKYLQNMEELNKRFKKAGACLYTSNGELLY